MVDLVKVFKKWGHWTSAETPPPRLDLVNIFFFFFNIPLALAQSLSYRIGLAIRNS